MAGVETYCVAGGVDDAYQLDPNNFVGSHLLLHPPVRPEPTDRAVSSQEFQTIRQIFPEIPVDSSPRSDYLSLYDRVADQLASRNEVGALTYGDIRKIKKWLYAGGAAVALGMGGTLVAGALHILPKFGGEGELSIGEMTAKAGTVTIGHEECWIKQIETDVVVPVTYKFQDTVDVPGHIPHLSGTHHIKGTTKKWSETMTAKYGVKVCNEAADMWTSEKNDKLHVRFKEDLAVSAIAYELDPTQTTFEESNNSLADFSEGVQSMVSAIPVLPDVKVIEEGKDFLKGVARTVGACSASEAVTPLVWEKVEPAMIEEIRSEIYKDLEAKAKLFKKDLGFSESQVVVDMPNKPTFTDPCEKTLSDLEAMNNKEKDGFTLSFEKPDFSQVKVDLKDLKVVKEQ
jgi:hypothetical protein